MRDRVAPLLDELVQRAKDQGALRPDVIPPDFPVVQLMLGAVTDHTGEPDLWRRNLALVLDGMRAHPGLLPVPAMAESPGLQRIVASSKQDADRRAAAD